MSAETTTYTERDMVLAKRKAYARGRIECPMWRVEEMATVLSSAEVHAAATYPLPKVTRPRVVTDEAGIRWCIRDGFLAVYDSDLLPCVTPTMRRSRVWASLFAQPTEEVEDNG